VEKMTEVEKSIHEALAKLTSQLASIEEKVDTNATDQGLVKGKVDLAMTSINLVQEEQV
jgi:hypothetical protein